MKLWRFSWVALVSVALIGFPLVSSDAQVICTGNASPPPELPIYDQPPIPEPGYIWTPGYWGGGPLGYFWVPGTWVEPPSVGLLWTPGYWAFRDGIYVWNAGYWGPHIGFYGGVNYGFGYGGAGYLGGRWTNGVFAYNRTVNNFGTVRVTNVYEEKITINNATRVSFNGGPSGILVRPTSGEEAVAREQHVAAIPLQIQHERTAGAKKELLASENHGRPAIAATSKPGEFAGKGVIAAREVKPGEREVRPGERGVRPGEEGLQQPNNAVRPADIGDKPKGRDATPKAKETLKQNPEPKATTNDAALPNAKPHREEAKLPPADKVETPRLREKPPEGTAGNPPPPKIATNPHPKPKPGSDDKKPPQ